MNAPRPSSAETPLILNVAAYKFVALANLQSLRSELRDLGVRLLLKGTILLSPEGLNLFVAGGEAAVDELLTYLKRMPEFADLDVKRSYSNCQPFRRMLVKIKPEIIAFGVTGIEPGRYTSRRIAPELLCQWLDEQRELVLLDVRNDYEVRLGTFENAMPIGIQHFRTFANAAATAGPAIKKRPVVMFCTGGIRCEKAGPYLEQLGFENVYQLDGGILRYFEKCGGRHYRGDCFVFDQRVALDADLQPTNAKLCFACRSPLTREDQQSQKYAPLQHCPYCYLEPHQRMEQRLEQRQRKLARVVHPLPGSQPYTNRRFLTVTPANDGWTLIDFLKHKFPFHRLEAWQRRIDAGHVKCSGRQVNGTYRLRAGERIENVFPDTVEPPVNVDIRLLYEDDLIVVVHKPAPLPMHPCGRFNRNSLVFILRRLYHPQKLRLAHRLDANTTGVVVFSRTRQVANVIQPQFQANSVNKVYLARVVGHPSWDELTCCAPIGVKPERVGARFVVQQQGLAAETRFRMVQRMDDGTTLLIARPITGRTNQIRVHAWHLGFPIVGDPTYLPNGQQGDRQTLDCESPPMCLHAYELTFQHPRDGRVTFKAPLPAWARAIGELSIV